MQFLKVTSHNLDNFLESDLYTKSRVLIIPEIRAKSMAANPSNQADNTLFYVSYEDDIITGFIGFLPDSIQKGDQVFWNSGWWVAENQGFQTSMHLLRLFLEETEAKLMITDTTEHTSKILKRIPGITEINGRIATRWFLRVPTQWTSNSSPGRIMSTAIGGMYTRMLRLLIGGLHSKNRGIQLSAIDVNQLQSSWIDEYNKENFVQVTKEKLMWIQNDPWVTTDVKQADGNYPFSYLVRNYSSQLYLATRDEEEAGWMLVTIINGIMKIPYCAVKAELHYGIASTLLKLAFREKCQSIYLMNSDLSKAIDEQLPFFTVKKKYQVPLFVSDELSSYKPIKLQDGDGDAVFT